MEQRVLTALVVVCSVNTLLMPSLGEVIRNEEDLKSICGNKCGNGVCRPVDSDMQYDCECNKGFRLNTDTGICEADAPAESPSISTVNTAGCTYPSVNTGCDTFKLQCNASQKIQILNSGYTPRPSKDLSSATLREASGGTNNIQKSPPVDDCKTDTLRPCNMPQSDVKPTKYSSNQQYDLLEKCSWNSTCQPPAVGINLTHSISYRCVPEQPTAPFCTNVSRTGRLINVVFDRKELKSRFSQDKRYLTQCVCDIKSNSSFRLSTADIRLVDSSRHCIPNATISGIDGEKITCSSDPVTMASKKVVSTKQKLTLSFDIAPEFIWIIIQAVEENGRLPNTYVDCQLPIYPVPAHSRTSHVTDAKTTTTSSTVKTETTTTTSTTTTGRTDTTTNEHTTSAMHTAGTSSTATQTLSNHGQENKEFQNDDDGVPLLAIIVPIVVILIGTLVAIIFWFRRRLLQHTREDDTDGQTKVAYQVPVTNGQIGNYESATPTKTNDNYLVLEQEHVYNTLDAEHNDSKTIKAKDMSLAQNNEYQTPEPRNNNRSGINEENVYTPLNAETIDTTDNIDPNDTVTLQNIPPTQTNEYFTLEPQNAILSGKPVSGSDATNIDGLDNIHPNDTETLQSMPPTQTNEYFILEPQRPSHLENQ